jgi:uncharacterized membrane protein
MVKRAVWILVGLLAAYVVALMIVTPTPEKSEPGVMANFVSWWKRG